MLRRMHENVSDRTEQGLFVTEIVAQRSFGAATKNLQDLHTAVAFFTSRVAEKHREHRLVAGELCVFIHTEKLRTFRNIPPATR
jgi:impB/mucB/samB family protein